jgi:carbamoyltransferase
MAKSVMRIGPRHAALGRAVYGIAKPLARLIGRGYGLHGQGSATARARIAAASQALARGETIHVLGIGGSGHNAGVGLVSASAAGGIRLVTNNEEERFRAIKHYRRFPHLSLGVLNRRMTAQGIAPGDLAAIVTTFDFTETMPTMLKSIAEEGPSAARMAGHSAAMIFDAHDIAASVGIPRRIGGALGLRARPPVLALRHHDNHAWFSYGVSPFAASAEPVMVAVLDGTGDDGSISLYVGRAGRLELVYCNRSVFDSLGQMYMFLSATQGGWPPLSSEGRFMGAAAWGDQDRLTNRYYRQLRELLHLAPRGEIKLNRALANWHRGGLVRPYTKRLAEIIGAPIPIERMWNPDAVLNVDDVEHAPATKERVDKAAAIQLLFEDALFHVIDHFIRRTGSTRLVLTGGTALNCVANMRLVERYGPEWYDRNLGKAAQLHIWVPPVPGDAGQPIGAAYHFACLAGLRAGPPGDVLAHAFYCGEAPTRAEIAAVLAATEDIGHRALGTVGEAAACRRIAEFVAAIVAADGVVGLYQGRAETGPRALGHRSILANPANPATLETLNRLVKYREAVRPLAPMATLPEAQRLFELSPGAAAADYNAYNYMVLTARAKPEAHRVVPAVVHRDGTVRVQIVRAETDPVAYAILKALGRRIGAEVCVNTSLNVGAPICQTPEQALETLRRSKGMHALLMIAEEGDAFLAWHKIVAPLKDGGARLMQWVAAWETGASVSA